jgi:ketosteroid isomerase-like protein
VTRGNADLIRPIFEEWGRGNWRPRFDVYHPQMKWGWSDEFPGLGGVCEDAQDPNPRMRAWLREWDDWRAEAEEFLELGDYVVVFTSYHGRGKSSGAEVHQKGAHVFKVRHGRVVRLEIFADRKKALESVRTARSRDALPAGR